jgi:hypothetical protein
MFLALTPGGSPLPPASNAGPHSAGWLSWFIIGAVVLIVGLAWFCLRGYRGTSSGE